MKSMAKVSRTSRKDVTPVPSPFSPEHWANEKMIEVWNQPPSAFAICHGEEFLFERRKNDGWLKGGPM